MSDQAPESTPSREELAKFLVDAINFAHQKGLAILPTAEHGVMHMGTRRKNNVPEPWIVDTRAKGVSPVGAAILYVQPRQPEPEIAACRAMNVSPAWMMGFVAGIAGEPPYRSWQGHVAKLTIGEGYVMGQEFRAQLMRANQRAAAVATVACDIHQTRYSVGGSCPQCDEADSFETPIDPNAGPWARR